MPAIDYEMESIRNAVEEASRHLAEHPEAAGATDAAATGVLGVDDSVKPGPLAVRVRIQLTSSDATPDQLREIVQRAEMRSPVRDALARALPMATEIVTGED